MSHADQELHRQINLLLSRLDEQQRCWYVAMEANRIGVGGVRLLAQITGLDEKTIQRDSKNWLESFRSARSSEFACPVPVDLVPKKRPRAREHRASIGITRDSGQSHE